MGEVRYASLTRTFPENAERMNEFLLNYPDHFLENAMKVEEAAFRLNTITSGELRCLL